MVSTQSTHTPTLLNIQVTMLINLSDHIRGLRFFYSTPNHHHHDGFSTYISSLGTRACQILAFRTQTCVLNSCLCSSAQRIYAFLVFLPLCLHPYRTVTDAHTQPVLPLCISLRRSSSPASSHHGEHPSERFICRQLGYAQCENGGVA